MDILLHTIALEPARWTTKKVSRPLIELLPAISESGFTQIEIFEHHLRDEREWPAIRAMLAELGIEAVVLSSYLELRPAVTTDEEVDRQTDLLERQLRALSFDKVRIFPNADLTDEGVRIFRKRLQRLAERIPKTEILLETHDGSLADDPARLTDVVAELALPNVGLLYQPTFFDAEQSLAQFQVEKPFIRHLHLQGRSADKEFVRLRDGIVRWERIIPELGGNVQATLEFVPLGICPIEEFNLAASLREAREEVDYVRRIAAGTSSN